MRGAIPFLDLARVHATRAAELEAAAAQVVRSGRFVAGPQLERFEEEFARFCGTRHCVGVGSGFDALRLLMRASGLSAGAEVLVPANTHVATVLAVAEEGFVPVLVEPDPRTLLLDPEAAERAITPRTQAVVAVHLYGLCAGIGTVRALADRHGLALLEDAAQAHGAAAAGRRAGSFGLGAGFSFYPTKNLGALGDAGAITTDDDRIAAEARALRSYGADRNGEVRRPGLTSRLDELQAALLRVQLRHLDADNRRRAAIAAAYRAAIRNPRIALPEPGAPGEHAWHLFVVRAPGRERLRRHLGERGVGTAVHYPVPPHRQPALRALASRPLPVTERVHEEVLSLPLNPALADEEAARVAALVDGWERP